MEETEHKHFFRSHKVLTFLPLLALAAGVFWYISRYKVEQYTGMEPRGADPTAPLSGSVAGADASAPEREQAKAVSALDIQGSPEFKGRITGALKLIWMADRDTFLFVKKYVYIIRSENKTDLYLTAASRWRPFRKPTLRGHSPGSPASSPTRPSIPTPS